MMIYNVCINLAAQKPLPADAVAHSWLERFFAKKKEPVTENARMHLQLILTGLAGFSVCKVKGKKLV